MDILENITMHKLNLDNIIRQGFSGSYQADQVTFLLQKLDMSPTDTMEKEKLIQSGAKHYSEMISQENPPSEQHLSLFEQAMTQGAVRFAGEVQQIAQSIIEQWQFPQNKPIVLVSFVRAGVPLGVLLKDAIQDLGQLCVHYGVSIVRDKGIDIAALELLIAKYGVESLVFVDGWTGKGAISQELHRSIGSDPRFLDVQNKYNRDMLPLVVLSDIGGCAWLAASGDDWLIPSGILGSTISGLISRSICKGDGLTRNQITEDSHSEWHGCIEYTHLREFDQSQEFIERINTIRRNLPQQVNAIWSVEQRKSQRVQTQNVVNRIAEEYGITNLNRIKPGIAEATRAILRRVPDLVLLQYPDDKDTSLLRHLATKTNTPVLVVGDSIAPYRAVTLIKKVGG